MFDVETPRAGVAWHTSVDGSQSGPWTLEELEDRAEAGALAEDTYVWREGFEDWIPAARVEALACLFDRSDVAEGPKNGSDLFATSEEVATRDVFSSSSAPRSALTGSRNESSVLFSLANLSRLSSSGPEAPAAAPTATSSSVEGSGLIDIRALASALGASPEASAESPVEDLLAMGTSPISRLGAPVVIPEASASTPKTPIVLGVAFAVVVAAAAAVVVAIVQQESPRASAAPQAVRDDGLDDLSVRDETPAGPLQAGATVAAPERSAASTVTTRETEVPTRTAPEPPPSEPGETEARRVETGASRRTRTARPAVRPDARARPPGPPARAERRTPADRTIAELMGEATDDESPTARPSPRSRLPETPSRSDVVGAMNTIASAVRACGDGRHGRVVASITFTGSSGRVRTSSASGDVPGPVRSCVARAARSARLPAFQRATFNVTYPFSL